MIIHVVKDDSLNWVNTKQALQTQHGVRINEHFKLWATVQKPLFDYTFEILSMVLEFRFKIRKYTIFLYFLYVSFKVLPVLRKKFLRLEISYCVNWHPDQSYFLVSLFSLFFFVSSVWYDLFGSMRTFFTRKPSFNFLGSLESMLGFRRVQPHSVAIMSTIISE